MIVIGLIIVAVIGAIANAIAGVAEGAQATGQVCPVDTTSIAKYNPALYDGNNFETGFEYGAEYVDVTKHRYNEDREVIEINWQMARGANITNVCLKIGALPYCKFGHFVDGIEYTETSSTGQGISHVEWCQGNPTAVTITSQQVSVLNGDDITFLAAILSGTIIMVVYLVVVFRNR